jgi:preprotein translocase subunit YajC
MIHSFTYSILAQSTPAPAAPDSTTSSLLMMGIMIVVFWLFLIRPQQKRQKEMNARIAALKTGDKVITSGGIHGTVSNVKDGPTLVLKVDETTKLTIDKSAIAVVQPKEA